MHSRIAAACSSGAPAYKAAPRQMRRSPERLTGLLTPLATIVG